MGLALAAVSVLLTLGILEGLARVARARVQGKGAMTVDRYMEYDSRLGWRKRPGARALFVEPEFSTEVLINSHGLRDPERDYPLPSPGMVRILALGDSFVEGYTVPLRETVSQVLEASLLRHGCTVEVLNGGTAGYSTDQEYLFYQSEGVRYSPRIVVVFFYFNDVLYNDRPNYSSGDPKPLLVADGVDLRVQNEPLPRPTSHAAAPAPAESQGSALLDWVARRLRRSTPGLYNRLAWLGLWPRVVHKRPPEQYGVFRRIASPEIKDAWRQTELILATLDRSVREHHAKLLLVYIPARMEVDDPSWAATQFEYGMRDVHWDRAEVIHRLEAIAAALQLPLLDLTPALRASTHGVFGGPYFAEDGHWNRDGHAVAAREVARVLDRESWLPGCPAP